MVVVINKIFGEVSVGGKKSLLELKTVSDAAEEMQMSEEQLRIVIRTLSGDSGDCAIDYANLNHNGDKKTKLMIVVNDKYLEYKKSRAKFMLSKKQVHKKK